MTTTPHGQVPEALLLADQYAAAHAKWALEDLYGSSKSYTAEKLAERHAARAKLERALRTAHVQNPAENEHVAGDVSKNGSELNMSTQQPAPAAVVYSTPEEMFDAILTPQPAPAGVGYEKELEAALRERDEADDFIDALLDEVLGAERAEWSNLYGRAEALEEVRERITALHKPAVDRAWSRFQAPTHQPAPATKQAGPIPEPLVKWAYSPELVETGNHWQQGYEHARAWVHVQLSCSNIAPQPAPTTEQAEERVYAFRRKGMDDFCTCDEERYEELSNKPHLFETRIFYTAPQPSPKAQAAESVGRDAERYRWLREGNDAKHGAAWHVAVNLYGCEWDAAIDAARTAVRENADSVTLAYRRSEDGIIKSSDMPDITFRKI